MSRRSVHLHIDRLVLNGFAAKERDGIAAGLRAELARQLAHSLAGLDRPRSSARLDAGRVQIGPDASARRAGCLMARRVADRIRR